MPQESQAAPKPHTTATTRQMDSAGYLSTKTIVALCTPTGGAICMIRISGAEAHGILNKLTLGKVKSTEARKMQRAWAVDRDGKKIDDATWVPFVAPHSFTGEDSVEIFIHGSPIVAQKILEEAFHQGARLALPGEFSFRAVKNGKFSISQAEAVKDLVSADNDFSLALALEKLSGTQHEQISKIKNDLMQLTTLSEVGIDFSDQDIDEVSLPKLKQRLDPLIIRLENLKGSFDRGKKFADGISVSIFGLPNAGKSSFFNALLGEDRSIVSSIAGTTRDVVREKLTLKGKQGSVTFKIADTAGLRKSSDTIEEIGIERSIKSAHEADLVIVVVDGQDLNLESLKKYLSKTRSSEKKLLWVVSKRDLLKKETEIEIQQRIEQIAFELNPSTNGTKANTVFFTSALNLEGLGPVVSEMTELAEVTLARKPGEIVLTQIEHVVAVEKCLACLFRAKDASDAVLFATDLRHAMSELGPLIGETLPDDVLGKIFSDFCIGK